jgi:hypothetical protein
VAVLVAQVALRRGPHMGEYERGSRLRGEALEVDAVPGRDRGGKDAGLGAEGGICVVAYAEAVAVMGTAAVETEAGVIGLG